MPPNRRLQLTGRMQGGSRAIHSAWGCAAAAARPAAEAQVVMPNHWFDRPQHHRARAARRLEPLWRLAGGYLVCLSISGPLTAQDSSSFAKSRIPPGVSCTQAQIQASATSDSSSGADVTPPLPRGKQPKPDLALFPSGRDSTTITFSIDVLGVVDPCSFRVLRETSSAWTESVMEALLKWRFTPARRQGRPIVFRTQVSFRS